MLIALAGLQGVPTRLPSHQQASDVSGLGQGGQCLLPTPGH
jgi:hypothetical protein